MQYRKTAGWSVVGFVLVAAVLLTCTSCAESLVIAGGAGGAAAAGGTAYYLLNLDVTAEICYYLGDEGALIVMPAASTAIDKMTIMACQDAADYLDNAKGLPAEVVNQVLTAKFANLDPKIRAEIIAAAVVLGQYVPSANVVLSGGEVNDLKQFVLGWRDGTQTVLTNAGGVEKQHAKATAKLGKLRTKKPGLQAITPPSGGWLNWQPVTK